MPTNFITQYDLQDIDYCRFSDLQHWYNSLDTQINKLQIIHINVCSLRKHFNEFLVMLNDFLPKLHIICLTEINITKEELYRYEIPQYSMFAWTREGRRGGGIILYVKSEYRFVKTELCTLHCEAITGELQQPEWNLHIFVIYRPPHTSKTDFISELHNLVRSIPRRSNLLIIGDININIMEQVLDVTANKYLNMMCEYGLQCGVRDITRECVTAGRRVASCIDHVFVRTEHASTLQAYTVASRVADHYIIGITADLQLSEVSNSPRTFYDNNLIINRLREYNWNELLTIQNPTDLYFNVVQVFKSTYKACTFQSNPFNKRVTQTWMNKQLQTIIIWV